MEEHIAEAMRLNNEALQADHKAMLQALTPSAETKAAYIGEFTTEGPNGESVRVSWTAIKEIMAAIRREAGVE